MSRLPLAQWDPSLFTELLHLLALITSRPSTSVFRRFFDKLDTARPWILTLTALPTQNNEDKEFIARSPISTPDGVEVRVTDELLVTTNTIAESLNLSHLLSAVLALYAVRERSRFPERSDPEIAVYLLHEYLQSLLDFVTELLQLTFGEDAEEGEEFDELRGWVEDLLSEKGPQGFLPDVAIDQIDALQGRIDTVVRTQASGAQFELLNFRASSLRREQNRLAGIIAILGQSGLLKTSQVVKIVKWLKKSRPDAVVGTILASFIAATPPVDEAVNTPQAETVQTYASLPKFMLVLCNLIFVDKDWQSTELHDAVKLHWSVFYASAARQDNALVQAVGLDANGAERHLQEAVNGQAFKFLTNLIAHLEEEPEDPTTALATRSDPDNNTFIYRQLQKLVGWLAKQRHFLRGLKNKEEDVGVVRRSSNSAPVQNFQSFLTLMAAVYEHLPPDSATALWDESSFTGVVLDLRIAYPPDAFWDLMCAISKGPECASKCFEKFKETRLSWNALFKFYQHYIELMPPLYGTLKTTHQNSIEGMSHDEYLVADGWTRLLANVVRDSTIARGALLQIKPHPLQTLFDVVNCDIATDLKAAVFEAINAFVERRGDSADDDVVARAVDNYERVTFADPTLDVREGTRVPQPIGWMQRMELAEQDLGLYPLTRAYIGFLTSLMPSEKTRVNGALRRGAMYVIDRVLLGSRPQASTAEQWSNYQTIMAFFDKALQTFDLTDLLSPARGTAAALSDQPGFLILLRILSEPSVFAPLADIVDGAVPMAPNRLRIANECLLRVLRIYHRILDIQLVFSDVLLLTLQSTTSFKRPLGFQSLDHLLLNRLSNVINIALSVGDPDDAVSFVSLKIIAALAQSPVFSSADMFHGVYAKVMNRLAGVIDSSDESIRIAQAFSSKLTEEGEDISPKYIALESNAVLRGENSDHLPILIRTAIVDMLVDNTADAVGPNIAHFLLGFDFRARELGLQDPRAPGSRRSCLQVILEQLNEKPPIIQLHPVLAAKSAQLIYQLFAHPVTGPSAMAYTESYEGFPARQLGALPRTCPAVATDVVGLGVASTYTDEVETSADVLVAYLNYQRFILASVGIQTFAFEGHGASSEYIAKQLFADEDDEGEDQRPPLLIDLLSNIDIRFVEADTDAQLDKTLEFYYNFNFDQYKQPGTDLFDLDVLARALKSTRRQLERQGAVIQGTSADAMAKEAQYILARLAFKNRQNEIFVAKGDFLEAWNEMLKVVLALLFHYVPEDRQEVLLFELLYAILDRMSADLPPGVLDLLSEAALMSVHTLMTALSTLESSNLPLDQMSAVLTKIIDAVLKPGTTEIVRGNLYASITQYLQIVPKDDSALRRSAISDLGARKDRFIPLLCRDAMDMRDVWKTECFSLLASIADLGDHSILAPLITNRFLAQFVRSIKDRELQLQECLVSDPDSLNAFWVYEANASFLTAYAGSPKGASELVDAGVFETLATCSFMGVSPFNDDVLSMGSNAEAVERQHRVLISALQLLVRILVHASVVGQKNALSLLGAHRDSFLILLRENQAYITATGIDESRLLVALFTAVVPKVSREELYSSSGFGAFHQSVLSLAAKFLEPSWADNVHSDAQEVKDRVLQLNQVIIAYLVVTTTGLKAGSSTSPRPVFVVDAARSNGAARIGSAPSLSAAVEYVAELAETLQDLSNAYDGVAGKLEAGEDVGGAGFGAGPVEELQASFADRTSAISTMIESLLLLIWRHMMYYTADAGGEGVRPTTLSVSFSSAGTNSVAPGAVGMRALERVAASLRGVLDRLDDIDVANHKDDAYYSMLVRRLRELCGSLTE
ncbi:hypothetical protein CspeluHIS016_0308210 [Cutaneotrichosporon spelunceum]|uniref:Nucleoporin n=1 Tax=Cutaneotrichosporon spelunceum TaxID=1672016 RepID=A0AAD3TU66_9TREE|nr:hypothetical protein CspeluHIS016_0308210 [Cutaneotrichosporon spelunceum]